MLALLFALADSDARAAALIPGDILVSRFDSHQLVEFTPVGSLVQTFNIPSPSGISERLRDAIVGSNGSVQLYNGTFNPVVTTLNPVTGTMSTRTFPGFGTSNDVSFGGIGTFGSFVFVTDTRTGGSTQGIIRFNFDDGSAVEFATLDEYRDLTIGGDGLLYALPAGSSSRIDVFNPVTLAFVRSINLEFALFLADLRGIAVNFDGTIYGAGFDGSIYAVSQTGLILNSRNTGTSNLSDIDLDNFGRLVVGGRFGQVILSNTSLATQTSFMDLDQPNHVAWTTGITPIPEPAEVLLLSLGALWMLPRRARLSSIDSIPR